MSRDVEHAANKRAVADRLGALITAPVDSLGDAAGQAYAAGAKLNAFHPVNELEGTDAIANGLWRPLRDAFPDLARRDQIVAAGEYEGADYVCSMAYLEGTFEHAWLDIPPSHDVATLRCCSIDRVEDGRIVESHVLIDTLDVMRQAGIWPIAPSLGTEAPWASPATGDGVQLDACDLERGAEALRIVKAMHAGLGDFDGESLSSMNHAPYWTPGFMWYGPSGIGTTKGLAGFEAHH
ncbi:MAG: ester cyclase, partial [Pseudomonadota bacterium]